MKLSQLCFYHRAFSLHLKKWIYIVGAICVAWALIFTFVFIFLCDPVHQQWTVDRVGSCMDQILVLKCIIMTNVITDLLIFVLPIYTVWNLQMRRTEKLAVISCFVLGLAYVPNLTLYVSLNQTLTSSFRCVIIGIIRFWQIFVIDLVGNLTGTSLTTFMLCTVELMLAGLCINIPMLRPFYIRFRAKYNSSSIDKSRQQNTFGYPHTGHLAQPRQGHHTTWIELVCTEIDNKLLWALLIFLFRNRITTMRQVVTTTVAPNGS